MEREEAERSLFGLVCAGVVEWGETAERKVLPELAAGRPAPPRKLDAAEAPPPSAPSRLPPELPDLPDLPDLPPLPEQEHQPESKPEPEPEPEPEPPPPDPESVRRELGDLSRVLEPSGDPRTHFEKMTPVDGFLLSRVDGALSASEVLDLAPMERDAAELSLSRLIGNGVVRWKGPAPSAAQSGTQKPAREERKPGPAATPPSEPAPKPEQPAPPSEPSADEERAKRREEIETLHARLKSMNHFEALGLPRASSEKDVKAAYFSLARRFHPDTHTDPSIADLEDKIEAIFIRVGEAYEVLGNRNRRASYESSLPHQAPTPASGSPAPAPPASEPTPAPAPEPPEDPMQLAAKVSGAFKTAAKLYNDQKYYDAIKLLETHLEHAEGPIRHRMRLLLAACNARNPAWAKQAEELILAVLKDDPRNVPAYLQLAQLYKERNLKARATSMFKKVLELDPENEAARAELGPPPEASASGGLLKKLFGRS
jgi:tetratricopeptide (TPR) repeat protein